MPILNYTTSIEAQKTAGEIQGILAAKGAHSIAIDYEHGQPVGLTFRLKIRDQEISFRLPSNWRGVEQTMRRDKKCPPRLKNSEQAQRVSWRILKDWVEAQLAIIESGQAEVAEVFLPYAITGNGQTLFQRITEDPSRLLNAGESVSPNVLTGTFGDRS
jgi:hypothetical protein